MGMGIDHPGEAVIIIDAIAKIAEIAIPAPPKRRNADRLLHLKRESAVAEAIVTATANLLLDITTNRHHESIRRLLGASTARRITRTSTIRLRTRIRKRNRKN